MANVVPWSRSVAEAMPVDGTRNALKISMRFEPEAKMSLAIPCLLIPCLLQISVDDV